ncbi:MAG: Gfo/Idh/MocA family oxidoreductase [Lachnospiraceae bacterium]|jgi:glycerol-3-phosphate cytidylyltransferase|nr:Gfo/Idh/MocA family oxidoreductase [Lachnospiraceae bacterium]
MKKVITYGSFDLFHDGHYNLLKRAKELGDYLIVGVTTEQYDESRGKLNVVDSLMDRIEHVRRTGFADEIIIEDHKGQKVEDILKYHVEIFTVGSDWIGTFDFLKEYCEVVYLDRTKDISSTSLRARNFSIIRVGVIGTGRIARRFAPEAKYVSGVNVECVYHPTKENAHVYAEKFELKSYTDDLATFWTEVDAVYIASPHQTHYGYAKAALEKKKHVLCEKPMVLNEKEAKELSRLAVESGCILFEAIKTAFCPGFAQLINIARSGVIGAIRDVEATFTKLESPLSRELTDTVTGGSFTELGSYALLPIVKLLGTNYQGLRFESIRADNGIDIYTKAYFNYLNGFATAKVGLGVKSEGQLVISGTKGYILVAAPWWKTESFEVRFEDEALNERYFVKFMGEGLRYELSDFAAAINGHTHKGLKLTLEESVMMATVMETFMLSSKKADI